MRDKIYFPLYVHSLDVCQTSLQEERDKLLSEKQSWTSVAGGSSDPSFEEAKHLWESERAELMKTSDEAKAWPKVFQHISLINPDADMLLSGCNRPTKKALEEVKNIRFSNVSVR